MRPKLLIIDGGVKAKFTCSCGNCFQVSIWGMIYRYTKQGTIISKRKYTRNIKKCKCGKQYLFVTVPEMFYKLLPNYKEK